MAWMTTEPQFFGHISRNLFRLFFSESPAKGFASKRVLASHQVQAESVSRTTLRVQSLSVPIIMNNSNITYNNYIIEVISTIFSNNIKM